MGVYCRYATYVKKHGDASTINLTRVYVKDDDLTIEKRGEISRWVKSSCGGTVILDFVTELKSLADDANFLNVYSRLMGTIDLAVLRGFSYDATTPTYLFTNENDALLFKLTYGDIVQT